MRMRMLNPDFWNDGDVGSLSIPSRLLFIGLISHADDEGRGISDPRQLRKQVFGFDEITVEAVENMVSEIAEKLRNVQFYVIDGKEYYSLANWTRYQKISHPSPSSLPGPSKSGPSGEVQETKPNLFKLYESNIGPLTPLIADMLKDAENLYPMQYVEAAMKEAVANNKRNWKYVEAIVKRYMTEGIGPRESKDVPKAEVKASTNRTIISKALAKRAN